MFKIVTVDDERMVKLGLRKIIESAGSQFQIIGEASNGCEAIEFIQAGQPHLIITDISMPVMDGIELIAEIKRDYSRSRIVILSGYSDFSYAQQALRYNVTDYLLKPIDPDEFKQLLLRLYEQHCNDQQQWDERSRQLWANLASGDRLIASIWELDDNALNAELDQVYKELSSGDLQREYRGQWCADLMAYVGLKISEKTGRSHNIHLDYEYSMDASPERICMQIRSGCHALRQEIAELRNWGHRLQIKKAIAFIEANYADDQLTLNVAAEYAAMSMNYFCRLFKEETGTNFVKYVTDLRLQQAQKLLSVPEIKVGEVAISVGYTSYYHFAKAFKKNAGISPTDYRKIKGYY